ncbi:MAG: transcriptional regulator MntR [Luteolibacter sp.]|jgi:Mn-dependent DtxR family transcriptional regulator
MANDTAVSPAIEDYLEQIHQLIENKGYARAVEIAEKLGVAQASVSNMLQRLDQEGYVIRERYRGVVLTDHGRKVAERIVARHELLTRLLRAFGLDEDIIYRDVEGMEHHISRPTLDVLTVICEALESDPTFLSKLRRRLKRSQAERL